MFPRRKFDDLRVVLVEVRNPLNIGAAARAMSNFGFPHLRVVNPYAVAFREARAAMGGSQVLKNAKEYNTVAEAVADCTLVVGTTAVQHRELQHVLQPLARGAALIRSRLKSGPVALLFGSEKTGLSNADLSHCDWVMHIPTCEKHLSMNLGQAVALCVYEITRNSRQQGISIKGNKAKAGTIELLSQSLLEVLRDSGYTKTSSEAATEERTRRMLRRLKLSAEDAELWLGMLRQIAWKIGSEKKSMASNKTSG